VYYHKDISLNNVTMIIFTQYVLVLRPFWSLV